MQQKEDHRYFDRNDHKKGASGNDSFFLLNLLVLASVFSNLNCIVRIFVSFSFVQVYLIGLPNFLNTLARLLSFSLFISVHARLCSSKYCIRFS